MWRCSITTAAYWKLSWKRHGRAHKNIAGLIVMYRESSTELAVLKVEHERLKWTLSDMYSRELEQATTQLGDAYGDYAPNDRT
jgi:hypothetical protein